MGTLTGRSNASWRSFDERSKLALLDRIKDRIRQTSPHNLSWCPHAPTPKQSSFLKSTTRETLYGGAAGGGKSEALLMAALQYAHKPNYSAILFRRTYSDLSLPGALMDRAREWLTPTKARWNLQDKTWRFPRGATLTFGYLQHADDKYRYQSSEFQFIGFDELTQFPERDYTYLFSRLRRAAGADVPLRLWSASNPGGIGHDWVKRRFITEPEKYQTCFVASRRTDNPYLDQESYEQSLSRLDPITRRQLDLGDWDTDDGKLLTYDMISACEAECLWDYPPTGRPELYLGVDIGRTHDLTVVWTWEKLGDVCWCREIEVLKGVSFREQKLAIKSRLGRGVVKCQIDKGGIGMQLAEELEREHPAIVEGVQLTTGRQGQLAAQLATGFGERKVRVPESEDLRQDLRMVDRVGIRNGVPAVETIRNGAGHADRFWAAALGYDAALHGHKVLFTRPRGFGAKR